MSSSEPPKKLAALLKKLAASHQPAPPSHPAPAPTSPEPRPDPVLDQMIFSLCLWENSTQGAITLAERLHTAFVDLNELRVAFADEVVAAINDPSPVAADRAARLQSVLSDIYERHHELSLVEFSAMGKREARAYLESMDALPQFAAARMMLLVCDIAAMPVDDQLRMLLHREGVVDADATCESAAGLLEKSIPNEQIREVSQLFRAWCDDNAGKAAGVKKGGKSSRAAKPRAAPKSKAAKPAKSGETSAKARPKAGG